MFKTHGSYEIDAYHVYVRRQRSDKAMGILNYNFIGSLLILGIGNKIPSMTMIPSVVRQLLRL